jgi:plastocyanin
VAEATLTRTGTLLYFCRPHPFMTGSISVAP